MEIISCFEIYLTIYHIGNCLKFLQKFECSKVGISDHHNLILTTFKVKLSLCFDGRPLKPLFVLKLFTFLFRPFGHVGNWLDKRAKVSFKNL